MYCGKMAKLPNQKEREMITTQNTSAKIDKPSGKLKRTVSEDINHPYTKPPGVAGYNPTRREIYKATKISTRTMGDVADQAEKRKRDEIMKQKIDTANRKLHDIWAEEKTLLEDDDLDKLWLQFVFVEIDDLVQAVSRRELK